MNHSQSTYIILLYGIPNYITKKMLRMVFNQPQSAYLIHNHLIHIVFSYLKTRFNIFDRQQNIWYEILYLKWHHICFPFDQCSATRPLSLCLSKAYTREHYCMHTSVFHLSSAICNGKHKWRASSCSNEGYLWYNVLATWVWILVYTDIMDLYNIQLRQSYQS